jgi:hypothetical protein
MLQHFSISFQKSEKTQKIIESKLNEILSKGKFITALQVESPVTGRLYYTIILKTNALADTQVKIVREITESELTKKTNELINELEIKHITKSISTKSNAIVLSLFYSIKTKNEKSSNDKKE